MSSSVETDKEIKKTSETPTATLTPDPTEIPTPIYQPLFGQSNEADDLGRLLVQAPPQSCPGCNFSNADLSGADLSGADLIRAYLWEADLSGANLNKARLEGAKLDNVIGADFTGAIDVPAKHLKD